MTGPWIGGSGPGSPFGHWSFGQLFFPLPRLYSVMGKITGTARAYSTDLMKSQLTLSWQTAERKSVGDLRLLWLP